MGNFAEEVARRAQQKLDDREAIAAARKRERLVEKFAREEARRLRAEERSRAQAAYAEAARGSGAPGKVVLSTSYRFGYVYAIVKDSDGTCKIGFSGDPHQRYRALHTGSSERYRLAAVREGALADETALHFLLGKYSTGGEWFRLEPDAVAIICKYFGISLEVLKAGDLCPEWQPRRKYHLGPGAGGASPPKLRGVTPAAQEVVNFCWRLHETGETAGAKDA